MTFVHTHTIKYEPEYALMVVRDADGKKVGMTATEAGAKIIRRRAEAKEAERAEADRTPAPEDFHDGHPPVWPNYIDNPRERNQP